VRVEGIDPSEGQLAFVRPSVHLANFIKGDAMALPFADHTFDAAVMALFFGIRSRPTQGR
jgi:ubiquinone/menaquinone biosynthesis C-methylase UbiE